MAQLSKSPGRTSPQVAARQAGQGPDPGDLMAVVAAFQGPLLRYAEHLLGRTDGRAEDVVQETFVRLHRQVCSQGRGSVRHLKAWLFHVAHNLTLDLLRQAARPPDPASGPGQPGGTVEERAADELDALGESIRQEARHAALRELARLDDAFRQVILLRVVQGMTLREVAEVIGLPISTVNYRLNHGLTTLAQRLRRAGVV
ncbi:MAG: sigma-70 family RNA polymerase sigma factor [Phycisphaerae bacterium]|nr:sigma-70 family RNA polymerase sigma factor [Phycisphaerae bacterium]